MTKWSNRFTTVLFDKSSLEKTGENGIERSDRKNKKLGLALEHFLLKKLPVRNHTNSRATNSRNKLSRLLNSWTWAEKISEFAVKLLRINMSFYRNSVSPAGTLLSHENLETCEVDPGHCSSTKKLVKWIRNARVTTTQKKSWSIWGCNFHSRLTETKSWVCY